MNKSEPKKIDLYQGFVKLQRSILDSPIIKNPNLLQIYIWCLLKANHKAKWVSFIGKEIYCNVGQFITGRKIAANELGMKEGTYYSNSKKLEDYGYITIESNNKYSIVTVVNYGGAAPDVKPSGQQKKKIKSDKKTSKEQLNDTNKNVKKVKKEKKILINSSFSNSLKNSKNENEREFIAFREIRTIIRESFPRVASIKNQLTYEEFKSIYAKYDWQDIINKIEDLENWKDIEKQPSLSKILITFLKNDKEVKLLEYDEVNSFWREERWYADTDEVDQYIEEVKDRKVFKDSKHSGSQNDMRHFIRQYLFWIKAFGDERYPKFKKLKPLLLRQALRFENESMDFWGSDEDIEDLHYSPTLKDCKSAYELLVAHSKYKWSE